MAATSLLRRLLDILKALISSCKQPVKRTRVRLLQKLAYLWTLVRTCCSKAKTAKTINTDPKEDPGPPPAAATSPKFEEREEDSAAEKNPATISTTHEDIIPLDSSIACNLQPDSYPNHSNTSSTSLEIDLRAARLAHTSWSASESTQHVPASPSDTHSYQEGYTFTFKSPSLPSLPVTWRQDNLSSPQLGSGSVEGEAMDMRGFAIISETNSSSSAESVLVPASVASNDSAESLRDNLYLGRSSIFPIMPEFFQRYDRKAFAKEEGTNMVIKSFTLDFRPGPDPPGWKPILHPEGILYFYNGEKNAVTEANLYEDVYYQKITSDIATLECFIRSGNFKMPEHYTLAMDLNMQPQGAIYTDYYYADHDRKIVFFLDDVEAETNIPVWSQLKGVTSMAHLKHEIEAQYWFHGMLYPSTIELTVERVVELSDVILHYLGAGIITSCRYSTSPYSASELDTMLSQVNILRENVGHSSLGAVNLLSHLMHIFARQKFLDWHGVPQARVYGDQSVHGERYHQTLLIKILSPLLFSAPDVHLANLTNVWVDGRMRAPAWREAVGKLNEEWREFTLCATVLLNANVAYLAIQSIDSGQPGYRSAVQVGCYLSIVASIGSIILGLLLPRQCRGRTGSALDEVNMIFLTRSHPRLGLESLAILYSLPYALLLWGMVSFLAAFGLNCFGGSNAATRIIVGTAWVVLAVLVLWYVWTVWLPFEFSDERGDSAAVHGGAQPGHEEGGPGAANGDAQSNVSRSRAGGTSTASITNDTASRTSGLNADDPGGSTAVGEMMRFKYWRCWTILFGGNRRIAHDSQRTAVEMEEV